MMRPLTPDLPPIALTMGDPAGVGPDITLLAWLACARASPPGIVVVADPELLRMRARGLGLDIAIREIALPLTGQWAIGEALPVVPIPLGVPAVAGRPDPRNAAAAVSAIEISVELVRQGLASALVTNPINKKVMYESGFAHPGHTEFLGELARAWGEPADPVMMLVADELKVVPVTVHIPLADVPETLNADGIVRTVEIVAADLERHFGLGNPRIAIAGLNPHAGEGGSIGVEESAVIVPALERLRAAGLTVLGPYPADTMFHAQARSTYDAAVAMYHDQALIPIKTLAFERAVNMTLGLPFIRTSPDHGTAYDVAGTDRADPSSLIHALHLAWDVALRRELAA